MNIFEITNENITTIRKTNETPPRISILDVINIILHQTSKNSCITYRRLNALYPDTTSNRVWKFPNSKRPSPVTDIRGIVEIIMLLPGRRAAEVRKKSADTLVRYLGGDPSMVNEIMANRRMQESLPDEHPLRVFGETVESESMKSKREELELVKQDFEIKRLRCEQMKMEADAEAYVKKKRIETEDRQSEAKLQQQKRVAESLQSYAHFDIPVDDRDKMFYKDLVGSIYKFPQIKDQDTEPTQKEIRVTDFVTKYMREHNLRVKIDNSLLCQIGKLAAKLKKQKCPGFEFPKKTIYFNGKMFSANLWYEQDAKHIEEAVKQLIASV